MSNAPMLNKPIDSPLKWAGSKRWCAMLITEFWKANERDYFVEPFAGAIASTLNARPEKAILNDINPHLINFYKQVQKGLVLNMEMKNNEKFYYEIRAKFNILIEKGESETKEAALFFYYLNKTGYNGLCRFAKKKGNFNVPFGRHKKINYKINFNDIREAIKDYDFFSSDFISIKSSDLKDSAFHFIDSPYDQAFSGYSKESFEWEDQIRTIEWAAKLEGPVLMTNNATDAILEELTKNGFDYKIVPKKHIVGPTAKSRKVMNEVFAWKNMVVPKTFPVDLDWKQIMKEKLSKKTKEKNNKIPGTLSYKK